MTHQNHIVNGLCQLKIFSAVDETQLQEKMSDKRPSWQIAAAVDRFVLMKSIFILCSLNQTVRPVSMKQRPMCMKQKRRKYPRGVLSAIFQF